MLELELQPWYDTTTVVDDDVVESRWVGCVGWLWTWRGSESIDDRVRELRSSLCSVSLSRVRVCVCVCVDRSIYLHTIDQPSNHPEHTTQLLLIDIYVYKIIVARSIEISPDSLTHIDRALLFDRSTDGIHLHQRTIRRRWIGPHQSTRLVSIALLRRWYLYILSTEWISTRGHLPVSLDIDPNTRDSLSLSRLTRLTPIDRINA